MKTKIEWYDEAGDQFAKSYGEGGKSSAGWERDAAHTIAAALCSIAGSLEVLAKESKLTQEIKNAATAQRRAMGGIR